MRSSSLFPRNESGLTLPTATSLMMNHNIPVLVVSRVLGHSRPSITLDVYGHLIPSAQAEVAEKMDELITPVEISVAPEIHRQTAEEVFNPHI